MSSIAAPHQDAPRPRQAATPIVYDANDAPPIVPVPRAVRMPLSYAQERLWFMDQLVPDNAFYTTVPMALRIFGPLDADALERAVSEIARRHESLRACFVNVGGQPELTLSQTWGQRLAIEDIATDTREATEAALLRCVREEAAQPFDLANGPVMRAKLCRLDSEEHVLVITMHHIISDGWSMGVLARELSEIYPAFARGEPSPLPEMPIQYIDFAVWQRTWLSGETLERQLAFWRRQLADVPALQLPTDHPRPQMLSYAAEVAGLRLPEALSERIRSLARTERVSLFMLLLAGFNLLLHRYSGQDDIVVGSPIANRSRETLESMVGFFVNTLALRCDLSGDPTVRELLQRVRATCFDAFAHQDLPFMKLVAELDPERDLNRNPIVQVMFAVQNVPDAILDLPWIRWEMFGSNAVATRFDQEWHVWDDEGRIRVTVYYSTELFEAANVERMLSQWQTVLEEMVRDPAQRIGTLRLDREIDRADVVDAWNRTSVPAPLELGLPALFEMQAARRPDAIAAIYENESIDYAALDGRANRLANHLIARGVGAEQCVAVCTERSVDMLVALLAVLKAGGAYLPIDPAYPVSRIRYLLDDGRVRVAITAGDARETLADTGVEVVDLERDHAAIAAHPQTSPGVAVDPEQLAYVLYTSGSTGRPKGVEVPHRAVVRLVKGATFIDFERAPNFLQIAPIAFDASTLELWGALLNGGTVVGASKFVALAPKQLASLLRERRVDATFLTSALFNRIVDEMPDAFETLDTVLVGGEAVDPAAIRRVQAVGGPRRLMNGYGPTENTTFSACHLIPEVDAGATSIPIGRPIENSTAYVLDAAMQPVPVGVLGELYVGGCGVARGYARRPAMTAEKFVPDPFASAPGQRLYRTGDLVRWRRDGTLDYLGRVDNQVKIRGHRIEPGEIEAVIASYPGVRSAAVVARKDESGQKILAAYVVPGKRVVDADAASRDQTEARLADWKTLYREVYAPASEVGGGTLNFEGWNSSYTGAPIPHDEMAVWHATTLERIRATQPQRVLEIGCGLGLLLFPLAQDCMEYWATDFSEHALNYVRDRLAGTALATKVHLLDAREAIDFEDIPRAAFDVVVINSVIQYFPDGHYLLDVLGKAIDTVRPGGSLFLGDVRNLALLDAYHASVQAWTAPTATSRAQLRRTIDEEIAREEELLLHPAFLARIAERFPRVTRVHVEPKRGAHRNELTLFRYDVTLILDGEPAAEAAPAWEDWRRSGGTLATLRERLLDARPDAISLAGIPNARLWSEHKLLAWLAEPEADAALRDEVDVAGASLEEAPAAWVSPDALWALAEEVGYGIEIGWHAGRADGSFDAVLWRDRDASRPRIVWPLPEAIETWANDPLHHRRENELLAGLRAHLEAQLPDYMVPAVFIPMRALPLNENGKLDLRALPDPPVSRPHSEQGYLAPATETQQRLAEIWMDVLGIRQIGIEDSFFAVGGHSLSATQVVSRIQDVFQIEYFPLRRIFERPTIAGLAEAVEEALLEEIESLPD